MAAKSSYNTLILCIIFLSTTTLISAVDIIYFLEKYPEFKTFSDLLNKTKVADKINNQGTVTVLLLDNAVVGPITGMPENRITAVLETHVILDYYDEIKLKAMNSESANATNLYQNTGQAQGDQGSTHIINKGGEIFFSSAAKGAPQDAKMVKVINNKPFSFSAIQINKPIVTPGFDMPQGGPVTPTSSPSTPPPTPAATSGNENAPSPTDGSENGAGADSPEPATDNSENGAPASEPAASSGPAPGPADDGKEDDVEAPPKLKDNSGGGVRLTSFDGGVIVALMGLAALTH